jgi:hypothetical protein
VTPPAALPATGGAWGETAVWSAPVLGPNRAAHGRTVSKIVISKVKRSSDLGRAAIVFGPMKLKKTLSD